MAYQSVFRRYELKYMLTQAQKNAVLDAMSAHMALDKYGRTTIRNIYFDTNSYQLIRHSIEKPVYKEKLRIRSYSQAQPDSTVFVELKKKFEDVVYKRRLAFREANAIDWVCSGNHAPPDSQIRQEIDYFLQFYPSLHPTMFLSYEREAFYAKDGSDFRVTFDDTILCRQEDISLRSPAYGTPILPEGLALMEIKCSGGIPLWMTRALSENRIFKTSFSKYGIAYKNIVFSKLTQEAKTNA